MIKPNEGRIIVKLLRTGEKQGQIFIPNRENVKAGENLYLGHVIDGGLSKFKAGQLVMFMEYSMAGFYRDIKSLAEGSVSLSETGRPENMYFVVAESDVMAYDAE